MTCIYDNISVVKCLNCKNPNSIPDIKGFCTCIPGYYEAIDYSC
jgi:hypothetical protein